MVDDYVHGYSDREAQRLHDQAGSVRDLFHHDTRYPPGTSVLEVGCGVGAQTVTLAINSPTARFVSVDWNSASLGQAHRLTAERQITNVTFQRADIFALPFPKRSFDHVWVCHVLEHLAEADRALETLHAVLRPGGSATVVEGDHGSCYFHPATDKAMRVWNCLITVQKGLGADPLIGRRLFPLLSKAGFRDVRVSPRTVYMDRSTPELMHAFVNRTIIPMVEGVREMALEARLIDKTSWHHGIQDLYEIARRADGTFCYTFFKGTGIAGVR